MRWKVISTLYRHQGGDSKQVTNTPGKEINISWTPDGKQLTFQLAIQGEVNQEEVWVASINSGEAKKLQRGYIPSSWSSDGMSYLAIGRNGELQRVSLDGTTIVGTPGSRSEGQHVRSQCRPMATRFCIGRLIQEHSAGALM